MRRGREHRKKSPFAGEEIREGQRGRLELQQQQEGREGSLQGVLEIPREEDRVAHTRYLADGMWKVKLSHHSGVNRI